VAGARPGWIFQKGRIPDLPELKSGATQVTTTTPTAANTAADVNLQPIIIKVHIDICDRIAVLHFKFVIIT